MKTLTTQHPSPARKISRKLLPALLVALFSFCAFSSGGQTWTVGTGTTVYAQSSTTPAPLGFYYPNARMQFLYDTASLRAAGMPVGGGTIPIHQIAFNVTSLQTAIPAGNFSLGADATTATALTTTSFLGGIGGLTNRYTNSSGYPVTVGWNVNNFSTPLIWNGTDNIAIEICYTTGSTNVGPGNAGVQYTATTGTTKSIYVSGTGTAAYCGTPVTPSTTLTYRPNIRFTRLFPCNGTPTAGTLTPSGTVTTLCPGTTTTIASTGYTNALGMQFQWMTASLPAGPWIPVSAGGTSDRYTTPPLIANTYYHLVVTCTNSGLKDSSANTGFTFSSGFPVYASIPYFEGFENWSNGCATNDKVSSNNWTNFPTTGSQSWRREDQGASASWYSPTLAPATAQEGLHSARFHSYAYPVPGTEGYLSLYINASATTGNKDLTFWQQFHYSSTGNYDSLNVDMSTDGGITFTTIGRYGNNNSTPATWNFRTINLATTSPTTVIRFRGKELVQAEDTYLDAVSVIPPCGAVPAAGTVNPVVACSGKPFTLSTSGGTSAAGLTYLWQFKPAGSSASSWASLPGGTVATPTATMTAATDYRVIVTCTNTTPNLSDTSKALNATLAPFYYCYCTGSIASGYGGGIYAYCMVGNTTIKTEPAGITLLNNGNPLPTVSAPVQPPYEDFRLTVPAPKLVQDSSYRLFITQNGYTSFYSSYATAWLDANRNGVFDVPGEVIMNKSIANAALPTASQVFRIGATQPTGLTGLRVCDFMYTGVTPCGVQNNYGQYEDYLVYIEYQPCNGPVTPGVAVISDTAVCPGYTVDLYDTSYDHQHTNILRDWEVSTNGGASFSAIPGSSGKDTLANVVVTATSKYRLRVICGPTGDTTYSNVVSVRAPEPVRCYPLSWAGPGGNSDSSDVGAFYIGSFINPDPSSPAGPHTLNPLAHKRRSDFTLLPPIELNADSTYRLGIFHTMPRGIHADALISVYMDFNNSLTYDRFSPGAPYTSELVFQGVSHFDSFFLDTKITIPDAVIPNVPTGMRVVLNNDLNPNGPGNTGAGVFTSGEVEDYIVIFRRTPVGVGGGGLLQNLALYPNPTEGKFKVLSDAARAVTHMDVVVSTITGQQVLSRSFDNVGTHFSTDLDLSTQAKGIYFVEIRADGEKITRKLIVR